MNARDSNGDSPLTFVCRRGMGEITKLLLTRGGDVDQKNDLHRSLLHQAVLYGHANIVKILLLHGAVVDAKDYRGRTPLHYAYVEGTMGIVDLLLQWKADESARDDAGRSPVSLCRQLDGLAGYLATHGDIKGE